MEFTMSEHTQVPIGPMSQEMRQRLSTLREKLLHLHKMLLDDERVAYERTFGRIQTNGDFFRLVVGDQWFAWLRQVSALIVRIDELLESEEENTGAAAHTVIVYTRSLLTPTEEGDGFGRSYFMAIQREPRVVMAHAEVRRLLG
jgi:hypothetical protein